MQKIRTRILALAAAAGLIAIDQLLKQLVSARMELQQAQALFPGLQLRYTINTGISFSMLGDSKWAMWVVTALSAAVMLAGVIAILMGKLKQTQMLCAAAFIIAGGVGNLIDRIAHGFVVDYLEFTFVRFAVFNFADICITCGVMFLAGWMIWDEVRQKRKAS